VLVGNKKHKIGLDSTIVPKQVWRC